MNPLRWARIKQTFLDVIDLPKDDWACALQESCKDDPSLIADVESLLNNHLDDDFISPPSSKRIAIAMEGAETRSRVGRMVGPYRLINVLDTGGMGHVYLAERADGQFEKQVAVKVIRRSVDTPELRRRFQNEQRTLAGLDHPNIAKLLDGGVTDDGLSYLVMDFVEGIPIDEYCDRANLDIRQRLELFEIVCRAVHFAHQRLIVHRDLKPGNILVTRDGVPKLLDFGIAKIESEDESGSPTRSMSVPFLTPEYASPEQIRGDRISTTGDVYSLGVILYELITGHKPHKAPSGSHHELASMICDEIPVRPSTAVRKSTVTVRKSKNESQPTVAIGQIDPIRLQRRLVGDLDNIVLMALRKEPHRRYGSAEQLAEDIRRHLTGLPVIARKDTFRYRASKFVQRNRPGVIAAAVVVLSFIGGIIGTSVALVRVQEEKSKSQLMNEYLQGMLAQANIAETGRDLTLSQVLDQAAKQISADFGNHPDIEAALRETIANAYISLRYGKKAVQQLSRAIEIRRQLDGKDSPAIANCLHQLGNAQMIDGQYEAAEGNFKSAIEFQRRRAGTDTPEIAALMSDYAVLMKEMGQFDRAEDLYREALSITERLIGHDKPETASNLNNLAVLLKLKGRANEAEELYARAIKINRAAYGESHFITANSLSNLATLKHSQGHLQEAKELYEKTLSVYRAILPVEHARTAITINNLASLLMTTGEFSRSEALFRECLAINTRVFGDAHRRTATTMNNLARLLGKVGEFDEAESLCRHAKRIRQSVLDADHPLIAVSHEGLGTILLSRGDLNGAREHFEKSRQIRLAAYQSPHIELANTYECDARLALHRGDIATAKASIDRAQEELDQLVGATHPTRINADLTEARIDFAAGEFDVAAAKLNIIESALKQTLPADHPSNGVVAALRAQIFVERGSWDQAVEALTYSQRILSSAYSDDHPDSRLLRSIMARLPHDLVRNNEEAEVGY